MMKLTVKKLKQLIKEEINEFKETNFGGKGGDLNYKEGYILLDSKQGEGSFNDMRYYRINVDVDKEAVPGDAFNKVGHPEKRFVVMNKQKIFIPLTPPNKVRYQGGIIYGMTEFPKMKVNLGDKGFGAGIIRDINWVAKNSPHLIGDM